MKVGPHDQRPQNSPEQDFVLVARAAPGSKRKISRNTNRLSTLSESSITYPVTNSSEGVRPCQKVDHHRERPRPARSTPALQMSASRNFTVCVRPVEHAQVEHQHRHHEDVK